MAAIIKKAFSHFRFATKGGKVEAALGRLKMQTDSTRRQNGLFFHRHFAKEYCAIYCLEMIAARLKVQYLFSFKSLSVLQTSAY